MTARLPSPLPPTIAWNGGIDGALELLDQTRLPHATEVLVLRDVDAVCDAILRLSVRGAPAIGVTAAYALVLAVARRPSRERRLALGLAAAALRATRPTAVNLGAALDRVLAAAPDGDPATVLTAARALHDEDRALCSAMAAAGAELIRDGARVLTHCNTGRLATAGDGTALAVVFAAHAAGTRFSVLADETRPLLQGARLTALELRAAGIPHEVIVDGAAASLMARGEVDLVLVGADRIARNGDVANKIGTYGLALAAKVHEIPFWVVAPRTTFDPTLSSGAEIPIEERDPAEVLSILGHSIAAGGTRARNPAFDVTPGRWITGFCTDVGLLHGANPRSVKLALSGGRYLEHESDEAEEG
ncbi:MAG: S-methyl-5-thioribose-1-phosphate isomerase [Planctomycetota bacterium]